MSKIFNLEPQDIENLELKLDGKLPINRDELLALVNSHGRYDYFFTDDKNNNLIEIKEYKSNEKFNLSKLDVSEITNFDDIFKYSIFNGDINSWDVSNSKRMNYMFYKNKNFNSPLDKWNTSNVTSMYCMFHKAFRFNQNLNSWNISKVINMAFMFDGAKAFNQPILWDLSKTEDCAFIFNNSIAFKNRFNDGKNLPYEIGEIKEWLIKNKSLMEYLNIEDNKSKELDNFLLNINNKDIIIN